MENIVTEIEKTDPSMLDSLLKAILYRYSVLFPDWEITAVSFQRNCEEDEQVDRMIAVLNQMRSLVYITHQIENA